MRISARAFIPRLFFAYFRMQDRLVEAAGYRRDGTNLCHMIRVVFFWLPLVVMSWAAITFGCLVLLGLAVRWAFFSELGWQLGVLFVDFLVMFVVFGYAVARWSHVLDRAMSASPSVQAVSAWVDAKHRKLCPQVEFLQVPGKRG